jgi:ACS family tartrate transporter-like MFS transporter
MEARVISKVSRRIVPFVALCYFVCYLDRVKVGFAALQMNSDLGFTATMFGWGAGIFFFGYFFFEVPSNLALERFGTDRCPRWSHRRPLGSIRREGRNR